MKNDNLIRKYNRIDVVVFRKTHEAYGGLSNMAAGFPIILNGEKILSSEALYQSCRFPHKPDIQKMIIAQKSPMTAKMWSKSFLQETRKDWPLIRVKVMRWCIQMKLAQNFALFGRLLLSTEEKPIVEESIRDEFWGAKPFGNGTLVGMNVLGRLLMELRQQCKELLRKQSDFIVKPPEISSFLFIGEKIEGVTLSKDIVSAVSNDKQFSNGAIDLFGDH